MLGKLILLSVLLIVESKKCPDGTNSLARKFEQENLILFIIKHAIKKH
jgi:hypothetical protein